MSVVDSCVPGHWRVSPSRRAVRGQEIVSSWEGRTSEGVMMFNTFAQMATPLGSEAVCIFVFDLNTPED